MLHTKKIFKGFIVLATLVSSSLSTIAAVPATLKSIEINGKTKEDHMTLPVINDQVFVPFRWLAQEMGITSLKWENIHTAGTQARITLEIDSYFDKMHYTSLNRSLDKEQDKSAMPLPERFTQLYETFTPSNTEPNLDLNKKGIEIDINSQGYSTGFMMYDCQIIDSCLYVPLSKAASIGANTASYDANTQTITIDSTTTKEFQNKIANLQEALYPKTPEETLALWIRGQQVRSGALQYAMLSPELQQHILPEVKARGWVTGGSSPTLRGGKVITTQIEKVDNQTIRYTVQYESMLQNEVYETLTQVITITHFDDDTTGHWLVTNVAGDVDFYSYASLVK